MLRKNQVNWSEKLENFKQSLSSSSSSQFPCYYPFPYSAVTMYLYTQYRIL